MPDVSSMNILQGELFKKAKPDLIIILLGTNDLKTWIAG